MEGWLRVGGGGAGTASPWPSHHTHTLPATRHTHTHTHTHTPPQVAQDAGRGVPCPRVPQHRLHRRAAPTLSLHHHIPGGLGAAPAPHGRGPAGRPSSAACGPPLLLRAPAAWTSLACAAVLPARASTPPAPARSSLGLSSCLPLPLLSLFPFLPFLSSHSFPPIPFLPLLSSHSFPPIPFLPFFPSPSFPPLLSLPFKPHLPPSLPSRPLPSPPPPLPSPPPPNRATTTTLRRR